jgi:hypothetical protein
MNTWFAEGWNPLKEASYKHIGLRAHQTKKEHEEKKKEERVAKDIVQVAEEDFNVICHMSWF